jgi:ABC-type Fe3+ transport system permease subunit
MGLLAWIMMGLAIWHFTVWLPDHFWGGIVGALVGALIGAAVLGVIIYTAKSGTFQIPGRKATNLTTALYAIPGTLIGLAVVYFEGLRRERIVQPPVTPAVSRPRRSPR